MQTRENNIILEESIGFQEDTPQCFDSTEKNLKAKEQKVEYAGFFTRLAASCIDGFIVGILLLVVRVPMLISMLGGNGSPLDTQVLFEFTVWDIIIYLLTSLYYVFLTYHTGATIGKKLLRVKVISTDGEKLSFMDILYRETIGKFLCGVTMNMGYILVGLDKEKRGFHDMLADTRVVYDFDVRKAKKKENQNSEVITAPSNYGYVAESKKRQTKESE